MVQPESTTFGHTPSVRCPTYLGLQLGSRELGFLPLVRILQRSPASWADKARSVALLAIVGNYGGKFAGGTHLRQSAVLGGWYFARASFESACARLAAASASSLRRSGATWPAVVIMIGARGA
jgi:hypothetical protein